MLQFTRGVRAFEGVVVRELSVRRDLWRIAKERERALTASHSMRAHIHTHVCIRRKCA